MRPYEPISIADVAASALACEGLRTRHLAQTFLYQTPCLAEIPRPEVADPTVLAAGAALLELFAARRGEAPPAWTRDVERQGEPIFLFPCKEGSFTQRLCLAEAPPSLRKRGLYAPEDYLTFV